MTTLNSATLRHLSKLKITDSLWEGDRRSLPRKPYTYADDSNIVHLAQSDLEVTPQCILWVDATKGIIRSMDVVDPSAGQEAFVRSLISAMERPQGPAQPALPQRILVRDRELQFYLRGILQGLKIQVDYAEELPLIEDIFANILEHSNSEPPPIPPATANGLLKAAAQLWENAPWEYLWDHQVIAIEMNCWDLENLFAVVMGHMGLERGIIFYRSYASLAQFRQKLLAGGDGEVVEETFLGQDCLFNLFEIIDDGEDDAQRFLRIHGWSLLEQNIRPVVGALHPLEGGRSYLYEEEAIAMMIALNAFNQFWHQHKHKLQQEDELPNCRTMYEANSAEGHHRILVQTMPDLAQELYNLVATQETSPGLIRSDLWQDKTLFRLYEIPWERVDQLRMMDIHQQLEEAHPPRKGKGISALMIQTTRPKALKLIAEITARGGIRALGFNPGESPLGESYELGLVILGNGEMQLFAEFSEEDKKSAELRRFWRQRCTNHHNRCVVVVAMGITGAAKGNPDLGHYLAYYEVELITAKELGLGTLKIDMDFDEF